MDLVAHNQSAKVLSANVLILVDMLCQAADPGNVFRLQNILATIPIRQSFLPPKVCASCM